MVIATVSSPFQEWKQINGEKISTESGGKQSILHYLVYDYSSGSERLQIDNYDINPQELEHLMEIYRDRSEQKSTRH
jgi:hypothetical protein